MVNLIVLLFTVKWMQNNPYQIIKLKKPGVPGFFCKTPTKASCLGGKKKDQTLSG